ncbi:MAG: 2-C-methyl-D-erythritol 4-phosphate cytidylyltransferase [Candidatus Kapabacteria bacterium]|nr:2-C-methyl-D-erythritol 4-phosphate cytidylyltransferase [Candidatus Kapabacteria bacterium]
MDQDQKARGVIIPAAGRGIRFGGGTPKQFLLLGGSPIIVHSVRTALGLARLHSLVIAVQADDVSLVAELLSNAGVSDPRIHLVVGSTERQKSVEAALLHESLAGAHTILVHDAVRPLASLLLWDRVATASEVYGAVVPAIPISDTVKTVNEHGAITGTAPRASLVRVQTPQGFNAEMLRTAYSNIDWGTMNATDCSAIVEQNGGIVASIAGEETNIKVTTPNDLELAEIFFARSLSSQ